MAVSAGDIEFIQDLFADLALITTRKMMGGLTIYSDGLVFAILDASGQLYLKAAGDFAKRLEAAGSTLFTFTGKNGKTRSMNYWTMPNAALDDPELAAEWAKGALNAAHG